VAVSPAAKNISKGELSCSAGIAGRKEGARDHLLAHKIFKDPEILKEVMCN
jgi:hypothetical protein